MTYYDILWHTMTCTHTHTSPCHTCSRCIMRCISKHSSPGTASSVPPAGRFQCWQQSRRSCNTHPATKSRGTTGCLLKFCPTPSVLWAGRNKFPSLMVMQYYKISSNHSCRPLVSRLFCPLFRVEKCVYIYTCVCTHYTCNYKQIWSNRFIFRRPWCGATVPLVKANSVTAASLSWVTSSYRL